jgi:hypothetical protein
MATPAPRQGEVPFEVHLPQVVGRGVLEPHIRPRLPGARSREQPATAQNLRDRAGCGNLLRLQAQRLPLRQQPRPQLPAAPRRTFLAQLDHGLLDLRRRLRGRAARPATFVAQPAHARFRKPMQPFVACLAADPKPTTQGRHLGPFRRRQLHEFHSSRHHRSCVPRHAKSPFG